MQIDRQPAEGLMPFADARNPDRRPALVLAFALVTVLTSAAILVLAVLAPAPAAALPLVILVCIGGPSFALWDAPAALATLRAGGSRRAGARALAQLRRTLDELPETEHPLGG